MGPEPNMTPLERSATLCLGRCRILGGTTAKRFVVDIANKLDDFDLSDGQRFYMWALCWRFRRQIPNTEVLKMAELVKRVRTSSANGNQ